MKQASKSIGLRELNKQEKLQRIKSAALELFLTNGFDETTTRDIASRANVAMGTVFIYAETKRDLLFLIVNEDLEDCIARAAASVDPKAPLLANLLKALRNPLRILCAQPGRLARRIARNVFLSIRKAVGAISFNER